VPISLFVGADEPVQALKLSPGAAVARGWGEEVAQECAQLGRPGADLGGVAMVASSEVVYEFLAGERRGVVM
jgi:hypothetical protein